MEGPLVAARMSAKVLGRAPCNTTPPGSAGLVHARVVLRQLEGVVA